MSDKMFRFAKIYRCPRCFRRMMERPYGYVCLRCDNIFVPDPTAFLRHFGLIKKGE